MKKLKKRKLAFATAVATLTASLSVFSGVTASAEWLGTELVVIGANPESKYIMVSYPDEEFFGTFLKMYTTGAEFAQIAGQIKCGDIIRHTNGGEMFALASPGIADAGFAYDDGAVEIVGSVFDTPIGDFSTVAVGDQILMQATNYDGTKYVFENELTYDDVKQFVWGRFTDEYHNEEHAIWVLPNEDGDVNSDDKVDSADAAVILEEIALNAVGDTGRMNASENLAADVNGDGIIDAQDAAVVLSYTSEAGSGMLEGVTLKAYAAQ